METPPLGGGGGSPKLAALSFGSTKISGLKPYGRARPLGRLFASGRIPEEILKYVPVLGTSGLIRDNQLFCGYNSILGFI